MRELLSIQEELKAPKNQFNAFGKYKYRSCEDILEAVKPLLVKYGVTMVISDSLVNFGDRYYIQATVTLRKGDDSIQTTALARESLSKKGMDESQITGTASSYARKYCLNGMFLIDDTKDADTMDNSHKEPSRANKQTIDTLYEWAEKLHQTDPEKASWLTTEIKKGLTQERANNILGRLK
jgi:hypothetical protein